MIYLDNAATTWPKPPRVLEAMREAVTRYGANPSRGGYPMAEAADRRVYEARSRAAEFFGVSSPERLIFTPGCTWALNTAIKGLLRPGDHCVISDLEHNAVVRPLRSLEGFGVTVTRAHVVEGDDERTLASFRAAIRRNTRMIVCTAASNVFGVIPPLAELGRLCAEKGLIFIVDAAQSAGTEDITAASTGAHIICAPAHKGLYGVMGLGIMALCGDIQPQPLIQGGTGSFSALRTQPEELPDRYESGTMPTPAILALDAGLSAIEQTGRENILRHEREVVTQIYDALAAMPGVTLYTRRPDDGRHAPLLAFNVGDLESSETAERLAAQDICVRAGYHCAFEAHLAFGTQKRGAVRIAPSMFTGRREVEGLLRAVRAMA